MREPVMTMSFARAVPTPLAAFAAGQSDVQPAIMRASFGFSTVFDDTAYEPGSTARLRLGPFDLTFALVYLVPLVVIALAGTRLSSEFDSGILRMIASQPVGPRRVALCRRTRGPGREDDVTIPVIETER